MSVEEYQHARAIAQAAPSLTSLLMAAMLRADNVEEAILRSHFPEVWQECSTRYDCARGLLSGERDSEGWSRNDIGRLVDPDGTVYEPEDEPE